MTHEPLQDKPTEYYTIERTARGDYHVRSDKRGIVIEHMAKTAAIAWMRHGNAGNPI